MAEIEKYNQLINWIQQDLKSYVSSKITTNRTASMGNSLFTSSKIFKNEKIISIPSQFNLNFVTVLQHLAKYNQHPKEFGVLKTIPDHVEPTDEVSNFYSKLTYYELTSLSSFQLITLYLVQESHRSETFWKPFLDILPEIHEFKYIPFTWLLDGDEDHFNRLPPSVKSHSRTQLKNFENDYKVVTELLNSKDQPEPIPKDEFLRYWLCCNSRCLYMNLPDELNKPTTDNFTMVPYVDFLNHELSDNCYVKINHDGFQVYSGVTYNPGDQIYLSYGPHSNEFLLCEYGFSLERGANKWNSIDITEQIMSMLRKFPSKLKFLEEQDYLGSYFINVEVSFRIEVALAVLQESDLDSQSTRRLTNFIQGLTGGDCYQNKTIEILKNILTQVYESCQAYLEMSIQNYKDRVIQRLHQDISDIALKHLNSF